MQFVLGDVLGVVGHPSGLPQVMCPMSDEFANSIVTGIRTTPTGVWHDIQGSQSSVPITKGSN